LDLDLLANIAYWLGLPAFKYKELLVKMFISVQVIAICGTTALAPIAIQKRASQPTAFFIFQLYENGACTCGIMG